VSDNFVTCRVCGIGINYACDHEDNDVPAEDHARLRAAAREALDVLTRLADSAYQWAGRDVPPGLVAEVDAAKARLAGVLRG
jgi:biotin-(acetyl-CoA carboxylase) ligase